jgi:hypothetical protein
VATESATAEQVISLRGGGAFGGIGESFPSDLETGTGTFSVPLGLPPGRNGFQPDLTLVSSSGQGNGPLGLGWTLSGPGVACETAKGVPQYRDLSPGPGAHDTFILSGAEDLVSVPEGSPGAMRDRPRTEARFARIARWVDHDGVHWEVHSEDGLVSRYGAKARAPGCQGWRDPAVLVNPSDPAEILAWKLSSTEDLLGNRIVNDSRTDQDCAGQGRGATPRWTQVDRVVRETAVDVDKPTRRVPG